MNLHAAKAGAGALVAGVLAHIDPPSDPSDVSWGVVLAFVIRELWSWYRERSGNRRRRG